MLVELVWCIEYVCTRGGVYSMSLHMVVYTVCLYTWWTVYVLSVVGVNMKPSMTVCLQLADSLAY